MSLPVLTAVTGIAEAPLVAGLERARGEVHVVRRCADLAELLAAAQAGLACAAVVSADLYRLDREAVAQLSRAGVAVVGLAEPLDPDSGPRLTAIGAGRVLPADAPAADVAAAVVAAVADLAAWADGPALRGAPGPGATGHPATTGAGPGTARPGRPVTSQGPHDPGSAEEGARVGPFRGGTLRHVAERRDPVRGNAPGDPAPRGEGSRNQPPAVTARPGRDAGHGPEHDAGRGPQHDSGHDSDHGAGHGSGDGRNPWLMARADAAPADPADALAPSPWPGLDDALDSQPELESDGGAGFRRVERGRIVAVWGPTGAPGRTTVALTLAGEFAFRGAQTLVVDADTYGPSVAQTVGLLDESGGIAGAVRSAHQGALDADRLARLSPSLSPTLRVLTGLPQAGRWPELRPSALEVIWERARELARWTVVDCGFGLEADEEISFDTSVPRRNGATLSALAAADVVLAVGGADPVGLQRLVRGLAELDAVLGPSVRRLVVITRVRPEAVGPEPGRRIKDVLARYAGVHDVVLVPDDRAGCDAAMLAGRLLVETVPSSAARRPFVDLAADLETQSFSGRRSVLSS